MCVSASSASSKIFTIQLKAEKYYLYTWCSTAKKTSRSRRQTSILTTQIYLRAKSMIYNAATFLWCARKCKKITIGENCAGKNNKPPEAIWLGYTQAAFTSLDRALTKFLKTGWYYSTNQCNSTYQTQQSVCKMYINFICWSIHNDDITSIMVRVTPDWVHCNEDRPSLRSLCK